MGGVAHGVRDTSVAQLTKCRPIVFASSERSPEDGASIKPWLQVAETPDEFITQRSFAMQTNTLAALDIGSREHEVVIGNQNGLLIDHFKMTHDPTGKVCFSSR